MKKFVTVIFTLGVLFSSQANTSDNGFQSIRLVIKSTDTAEDIEGMQQFMEDNGYSLTFDEIIYNEDGYVISVSGKVDFGNSSGTFSSNDLRKYYVEIRKSLFNKMRISVLAVE